jgi:arylsulfatase A-like enzyme
MVVDRGGKLAGLGRVEEAVSTLDLAPTILSRLQIDHDVSLFDGTDLAQLDRGRVALSSWRKLRTVRNREWKLILRGSHIQLYNLVEDPYESSNQVEAAPEVATRLVESLGAFSGIRGALSGQNEELLKTLRTLGYVD